MINNVDVNAYKKIFYKLIFGFFITSWSCISFADFYATVSVPEFYYDNRGYPIAQFNSVTCPLADNKIATASDKIYCRRALDRFGRNDADRFIGELFYSYYVDAHATLIKEYIPSTTGAGMGTVYVNVGRSHITSTHAKYTPWAATCHVFADYSCRCTGDTSIYDVCHPAMAQTRQDMSLQAEINGYQFINYLQGLGYTAFNGVPPLTSNIIYSGSDLLQNGYGVGIFMTQYYGSESQEVTARLYCEDKNMAYVSSELASETIGPVAYVYSSNQWAYANNTYGRQLFTSITCVDL